MPTHVLLPTLLLVLIHTSAGPAQEPSKPVPPWERRDILGRPIPWGKEVAGQRVCLWMPATRLLYGQPIDIRVQTGSVSEEPPNLRVNWDGPERTAFFDWTNDQGETVTFDYNRFRLQPTGKFAHGQYLVPGKYRVRLVIEAKRNPQDPIGWVGRLESNLLEFVVLENDEHARAQLVPNAIRARTVELVRALDDKKFARREQAERELLKLGFHVLPLLEQSLESPSKEARTRSERIFRKLTEPLFDPEISKWFHVRNQTPTLLSIFRDAAWNVLGDPATTPMVAR